MPRGELKIETLFIVLPDSKVSLFSLADRDVRSSIAGVTVQTNSKNE